MNEFKEGSSSGVFGGGGFGKSFIGAIHKGFGTKNTTPEATNAVRTLRFGDLSKDPVLDNPKSY